jgi:hypothetical protein
MGQHYTNVADELNPHRLPDIETFQLTAHEAVALHLDLVEEYMREHEFRFAAMNSRDHARMIDAIVEREGVTGGWFYTYGVPGCLPDSPPMGPFDTEDEALEDARS